MVAGGRGTVAVGRARHTPTRYHRPVTAAETPDERDSVRVVSLYAGDEIDGRVAELAGRISRDCTAGELAGGELTVVGVLKGAFVFTADLVRKITLPCRCDFLALRSYGAGTVSSGEARITRDLSLPLADRDVLVVEDIVDTGRSLQAAVERVERERPRSVRTCALLDKPSRREVDVTLDYVGFTVADRFVVGYSIDWDERFRDLPYIGYVEGV